MRMLLLVGMLGLIALTACTQADKNMYLEGCPDHWVIITEDVVRNSTVSDTYWNYYEARDTMSAACTGASTSSGDQCRFYDLYKGTHGELTKFVYKQSLCTK